jgi:hypothetical protein
VPSVWSSEPYDTEDDARRAGMAESIDRTQRNGGLGQAERAELDWLRKALQGW